METKKNPNALEDVLKQYESKRTKSKRWLLLALLVPVGLIGFFLLNNYTAKREIEGKALAVDALRQGIQDSLALQERQLKRIRSITEKYLHTLINKQADSLASFYTDTLQWYYLQENYSKADVKKAEAWWFKKYPQAAYQIDSIEIAPFQDRYNAYVSMSMSKNGRDFSPAFVVIKLTSNGQIFFVKSYLNEQKGED